MVIQQLSEWTYTIKAFGNMYTIEATVTKSGYVASKWIDKILRSCSPPVVGLGIEWRPKSQWLCSFLRGDRYRFVGVGIREDAQMLLRWYDLDVRSCADDLRNLAAKKTGRLDMKLWGLQRLVRVFMGVHLEMPMRAHLCDWGRRVLEPEQIEYAALDAFASFEVGRKLVDCKALNDILQAYDGYEYKLTFYSISRL
ncbi:hypothetical protein LUZ63_013788 [Rhynchospora breviuscula]|uniref:3'-5' exonuclease domain-containing protein n=1 Tax=Rhynchospora breviuscula TaxID=2022672 RepID=A0A9Q0C989_9POAL|nr:hypothetical protein LUZ63_013788 [Rhynchospora breviuscula]